MKSLGSKSFWNIAIMFTAILLCNIGAKWGIVDNYGSYSPNWDEWEAHGVHLLKPWIEGDFSVKNLLAAHNEHRLILPRLLTLSLFSLNGNEWNPMLEMTVNALIYSVGLSIFFVLSTMGLSSEKKFSLSLWFLALTCIPFGWENLLNGFQSQFYLSVIFSLISLFFLRKHRLSSTDISLAVCCYILGYSSFTSGIFVLPSLILAYTVCFKPSKSTFVKIVVITITFAVSYYFLPKGSPNISAAKNASDFVITLTRCLAFPYTTIPILSIAMYLPTIVIILLNWRKKFELKNQHIYLILVAFLTIIISAGLGYARSSSGSGPSPRYLDLLIPGLFANIVIFQHLQTLRFFKKKKRVISGIFTTIMLIGLILFTTMKTIPHLEKRKVKSVLWENSIRQYVEYKDDDIILCASDDALPFPIERASDFKGFLDDKTIINFLPGRITNNSETHLISNTFDRLRKGWLPLFMTGVFIILSRGLFHILSFAKSNKKECI